MCTEAGLFAIRAERDYVLEEDFMKVRLLVLLVHSATCSDTAACFDIIECPISDVYGLFRSML